MRYRRLTNPGARYFFTLVTEQRRPILIDHIDVLRRAFAITRRRHPFSLEAVVVLPDHLHAIWHLPADDNDPARRWRVLKRLFSARVPIPPPRSGALARKRESGIWQRRFWEHCIGSERDWWAHVNYIHLNPVRHGYCERPEDWPYSSYQRMMRATGGEVSLERGLVDWTASEVG